MKIEELMNVYFNTENEIRSVLNKLSNNGEGCGCEMCEEYINLPDECNCCINLCLKCGGWLE